MIFAMAFDAYYAGMGSAVIHALNFYHGHPTILLYTDDPQSLRGLASKHRNVEVIPFVDSGFHHGEWHPLIWAKLEAFRIEAADCVVFLDADMIVYNELGPHVDAFCRSGKLLGASTDFAPFVKQFNSGFDFREFFFGHILDRRSYLSAPAFNAGALVFKPDKAVYKEIAALARKFHDVTFYPEQAILNLFAMINDAWCPLEDLSVMPFDRRVLDCPKRYGMIHCFTPRPTCMLPPVVRAGEPTLEDMARWFADTHGVPYPLSTLERDFVCRRDNLLSTTCDRQAGRRR
jgi:hypothetical protein